MSAKNLNELFVEELKDIYDAEKQLTKALPKMAKAADNEDLRLARRPSGSSKAARSTPR